MDFKLLLVKSITLLYRESQLPNQTENSSDLVKNILFLIKTPENFIITDFGKDVISSLRSTAVWMANNPFNYVYNKNELLQRLRVNVGDDDGLFEAFQDGISEELGEDELKKTCLSRRESLKKFLDQTRVKEILDTFTKKVKFQEESIDWRHFVREVVTSLEPFVSTDETGAHSSIVDDVNFSDVAKMRSILSRGIAELDTRGIIQFGWQGLNRMFGNSRGGRRGEMIVVGALQHNFKSGFCIDTMKHAALYNRPNCRDPNKKGMLMRISLENDAPNDILTLYKSLAENETGLPVDISSISEEEVSGYVRDKLTATGFELNMCRLDPSEFTYHDLFDRINKYEADGFEIHGLWIDYLNMMSKRGCAQGPAGVEVRDLFRRTRNFTSKKGILCITPHQLSTQAKDLVRLGTENFVQEIANKGYYDSCKTIDQEVDMEIYIHKIEVNGEAYLAMQRGKHRKVGITKHSDLYCVYKFDDIGGIRDDIMSRDMSRKHVGGSTMADGGGAAWYTGS